MTDEQKWFLENVKILYASQEHIGKNDHILNYLKNINVAYEKQYAPNNLKQGDYTFKVLDFDYRDEFLIERKFGLAEIYPCIIAPNILTKAKEQLTEEELRNNLEYEFMCMCDNNVEEKWLFIEDCQSLESIKAWKSGYEKRNINAGKTIYTTLTSWSCANRYDIKITCMANKNNFAPIMLTKMFYYWRNDCINKYGTKNFLKYLK